MREQPVRLQRAGEVTNDEISRPTCRKEEPSCMDSLRNADTDRKMFQQEKVSRRFL